MDDATIELLQTTIKSQLEKMSDKEFNLSKRKNFDTIAYSRYDLSKKSFRFFDSIIENNYDFPNFRKIELYSKIISKKDIINFFQDKFLSKNNLKFTVYVRHLFKNIY
jgi:secreted Zn-dependent insulinase-like peptidase